MTIAAGTQFLHYIICSQLGAGGMGEVYLAEDTRLDRKVALKLLPAAFTQDQDRVRRFIQEAKAASALNHPNIITIHEIGEANGTHFIATEFIDGQTLRARLAGEKLTLLAALEMSVQVASALVAAHEAGIVHRDIKPENVMLRRDGIVKVLDFGLAKLTEKQVSEVDTDAPTMAKVKTEPGTVMGTASYMSPEQARGQKVDGRTDLFSFGVVLYEMLAGKPPFEGVNALDVIGEILKSEPQPLQSHAAEIPPELQRIVGKTLRKNRDERYQTARDLLNDLKDFKEEISFAAKRARSGQAERNEAVTSSAEATPTAEGGAAKTSSAKIIFAEIKRHRLGVGLGIGLLLLTAVAGAYFLSSLGRGAGAINSIAVLPLVNASNNPDTEYLSDGISESLINSLTALQQLRVIARTTAFRYKGKEVDPRAVGRELNVGAVLMGRVRQVGDRLNIQVDLVDATTGDQLWGEEYERAVADVLSIKQAIAREVTEKLKLRLSGEQQQQLAKRETTNPAAYQYYLRGRYLWSKRTADAIRKAIEQFQQALELDSTYALGYVGLADCYLVLEQYGGVPTSEMLPKASAAVDRALQIDDSLAEAHTSLAEIYQRQWRWAEAEQEFRRAISLNPNYPTAHAWFTMYFRIKRRFDDALRESKRAQELDPLSPIGGGASIYLLKNDINSAIEQNKRHIAFDPNFAQGHRWLGLAYIKQRRYEEALTELQQGVKLSGRSGQFLGDLGYCYALMGKQAEARQILKELEERYDRREATGINLAQVYAGFGDKDQVFDWLEKDFQQRSGVLPYINWWVNFDDLRSDPRYADLLRRMGLEP